MPKKEKRRSWLYKLLLYFDINVKSGVKSSDMTVFEQRALNKI